MVWIREYSKDDTQECIVYALVDPRTFQVRYIGESRNLLSRFRSHIYNPTSLAMREWIADLKAAKLKPALVELERTIGFQALKVEYKWICIFREAGAALLNQKKARPDYRALTDERGYEWTRK